MPVPPNIAKAAERLSVQDLATEHECVGSKFHSPAPLIVREYIVFREGLAVPDGPIDESETVRLCGTCKDNLNVLLRLLTLNNGVLPWETRREFGNVIRDHAKTVWGDAHA